MRERINYRAPVHKRRREFIGAVAKLGVLVAGARFGVAQSQTSHSFYAAGLSNLVEQRRTNTSVDVMIKEILARVDGVKKKPLLTRANSLAQLASPGRLRLGGVDGRTYEVQKSNASKANQFALAMADSSLTQQLFDELPFLAASYALTGDSAVLARITAQLTEVLTWRPLQRPGWTLYNSKVNLPPDGNDGAWLATGMGIVALATTLEILPTGSIAPSLRAQVIKQVTSEAIRVIRDWNKSVQWFVREHKPTSNQWIVVASAAVIASTVVASEDALSIKNFGVEKLLESLEMFGDEGAVSEGFVYGLNLDAPFIYLAARAAVEMGDSRLLNHPFVKGFPRWLAQQFQPANSLVNCFDTYTGARLCYPLAASNISLIAVLSDNPEIFWIKNNIFSKEFQSLDLFGLLALGRKASYAREPEIWGAYKRGALVTWRSDWGRDASGVWLRGGHPLDTHDHNDRGHVNYIANGKIVLIEAGTPTYADPEIDAMFKSVKGHNVLQVGEDMLPKKMPAPIYIKSMNRKGGAVEIDAGAGYAGVTLWRRSVVWNLSELNVTDTVNLAGELPVLFRWHFASEESFEILNENEISVTLPAGKMIFPGWNGEVPGNLNWVPPARDVLLTPAVKISIAADQEIFAHEERDRDHTLKFRFWNHRHAVLVVRTRVPVSSVIIKTSIVPA